MSYIIIKYNITGVKMAYSIDLRVKLLAYVKEGNSRKDACKIFGVSLRTLVRWLGMEKQGCLADPKPKRPWKKIDAEKLLKAVEENPGKTLSYFAELFGVKPSSMFNAFKVLKITRKKRLIYTESGAKRNVKYSQRRLPTTLMKS